jgi:hypothetical protein
MSAKPTPLTPLQQRKAVLVVEAEQQREQFCQDAGLIKSHFEALATQAKSVSSMASVGGLIWRGISVFRRRPRSPRQNGTPSLVAKVVRGAGLVSSLWFALRSRRH